METIGPTTEWRRHNTYEPPLTDQKTKRTAGRRIPLWDAEFRRGVLELSQFKAAERFHVSWHGEQGHDMRRITGGQPRDPDYPSQEAYASAMAHAKRYVPDSRVWKALEWFCVEERELRWIGAQFRKTANSAAILRSHGLAIVGLGLDGVAKAWGLEQHQRSKNRKAA